MEKSFKKAVLGLLGTLGFLLITAMVITIVVDPFFHYHKPLEGFAYQVDNQLTQNPGMAEHMDYDSVILGSSMTVNFETDWFRDLMGLNTIKLSYSGAFPKDQANIMDIIFDPAGKEKKSPVKKVFLGIDVITYTGDVDQTKYPIPEYLYDENIFNDVEYVLNKDVLLNYCLRPIADPEPTNLSHVYASWWTDDYYSESWVLHNYTSPQYVETETPTEAFAAAAALNLEQNICPYIKANKDTEFIVFFPPYSILFWNDVLMENHLDATLREYEYIGDKLNSYENVSVYFFPDREDIILDLNHYADYSHYHPRYNYFMTECFANGECLVAKEGMEGETLKNHLDSMRAIVEQYDFEELREKINQY